MTDTAKPTPNNKLRYERERRGWSQQDLADRVGTTPLNVSRWERGVTIPGPFYRQKLSEVFEKSPYELGLVSERSTDPALVEISPPPNGSDIGAATPMPLWNVPYGRNSFFTGREEVLDQLRAALSAQVQPIAISQPQAISGLGGIGKTQMAIEYAYRYRESYDAVFWTRADSADLLISDFLIIAALLNLPQRNEQDQNVIVTAVKRWFDTHERWLLILDNIDHLEELSEFLPSAGKGHLLLTTRAQFTGTIAQCIEIGKMGLDEGVLFLLRRVKRLKGTAGLESLSDSVLKQAQAIVEALDGLPLALDQAGAYIEETGCSLSDYFQFYQSRRKRLLRLRGYIATGHPEPVATTWSLAFEKVKQANPAASELLQLCAFIHPDMIPEAMIIKGASELGPVLQFAAEDEIEWNEAIGELRKYSLVKRDSEEKILNIHRLVQAVIKDEMNLETQREWAKRAVLTVNKAFPEVEFATWPTCQQYLPHAQVCIKLINEWKIGSAEAGKLLSQTAYYLFRRGQYDQVEPYHRQALMIREQLSDPNYEDLAQTLNDLADLYKVQGQYAAAESFYLRALAIREKHLDAEHLDTAYNLNTLGELYYYQNRYVEAEQAYKRALALYENRLGPEHWQISYAINDLAVLYFSQGKYTDAEAFHMRALSIRERSMGTEHPDTAHSLSDLATLYSAQGKLEKAEQLYLRSIAIREQALGLMHPDVAINQSQLAIIYHTQGHYEQAEAFHKQALEIFKQKLGAQHPNVGTCLNHLGTLYRDQGKYIESEAFLQQSLVIRKQNFGPVHPRVAQTLNELALLYCLQQRYAEAEALYQQALAMREQTLGEEHPDVAITLENYAALLRKTGRESEASDLEARAQAIRAKQE